ncbi:Gfo/Idh/MocA family oxidoreductase [Thalassotalea profundi]|uniref:Alpha-N-acetylgalactosaminidase n=1 Tax=Thalassotalea profundi TaxID=2036687 RepID=A0ABQ3IUB5_9GAMM|nr:Gfo/Idh/MocA family oxidoreductase [Thalassotalea profundi]GHE91950.1 alpha-N-acetylgalactosaminidase [Thalassotalea profundi]
MSTDNRRNFLKSMAALTAAGMASGCTNTSNIKYSPSQGKSVAGLTVPKMDIIRVGFIGVGERGYGHVKHFCHLEGVSITAICDTNEKVIDRSLAYVQKQGLPTPARYSKGELAYKDMLERQDIDIIIISTPWRWHTPMAVDTMESGKHAFVEVPAATTVDECWQLVNTAERTQKNCMMMENVCYGRDELMVLNMVRQGLFGQLLHGEAAYIHELRWQMKEIHEKTGSWRTHWHTKVNGNLYPTHGLGPVSQYMNINRGDRFDYLTSTSSPALGRKAYAQREFPVDHERNQLNFIAGDMNTTMIKTVNGRSIMVQHDTTTPRPYSRHNYIQGTNGAFSGFPNRIALEKIPEAISNVYQQQFSVAHQKWVTKGKKGREPSLHNFHHWDYNMAHWQQNFDHPLWIQMGQEAQRNGGHGGMDFLMLWRMVYCLRNGEALDQDVYDAASWSVITPLSADSVSDRSNSKDIPDFTRGHWKTNTPLTIVT